MGHLPRVCHITTAHPSKDVRIYLKECNSLMKAGYPVSLIAVNTQDEISNGINIINVSCEIKNRADRIRKALRLVFQKAKELDAEIYHFHDPDFLPYARKLIRYGKKVIYDAHEDVPRQILSKYWIPKFFRKPLATSFEIYENSIVKELSYIVAATPYIRDRFYKYNKNTIDINNYPILDELSDLCDNDQKNDEVCYIGSITRVRGIVELVDSVENAPFRLNLCGQFEPENLREELSSKSGWDNVNEMGFVNREGVKNILRRSKAGLVTLHPIINYRDALPVKMFEYMAAGLPVIASDIPLWQQIIETVKCGICVNPFDPVAIRSAIDELTKDGELAAQMGANGKSAVLEKFNWTVEEKKLLHVYSTLI